MATPFHEPKKVGQGLFLLQQRSEAVKIKGGDFLKHSERKYDLFLAELLAF
ncbi:hypothetical protein ACQKFK_31065 [Bacillus mycoides]|uniref:hypothetical protein n=1 Tax=Bacillus mycoides TaxID=1405 RepID=UPI003CFCA5D2